MPATATPPASPAPAAGADRPGQTIVLPGQTPQGEPVLGVLVKRTYTIAPGKRCRRAEEDRKLVSGDAHYDDPLNSPVKFESDFVPFKLATDVVLNGKAYAPGGRPARQLTASLAVGGHRKDVLVQGDRVCHHCDRGDPAFGE